MVVIVEVLVAAVVVIAEVAAAATVAGAGAANVRGQTGKSPDGHLSISVTSDLDHKQGRTRAGHSAVHYP